MKTKTAKRISIIICIVWLVVFSSVQCFYGFFGSVSHDYPQNKKQVIYDQLSEIEKQAAFDISDFQICEMVNNFSLKSGEIVTCFTKENGKKVTVAGKRKWNNCYKWSFFENG